MVFRFKNGDAHTVKSLTELAQIASAASSLLHRFLEHPTERRDSLASISEMDQRARSLVHDLGNRLDKIYVSSPDLQDIHGLAIAFGRVIDVIGETARRAETFKLDRSEEAAVRLAQLLNQASVHLEAGVAGLRQRKLMLQHRVKVRQLEAEGDLVYYAAIGALFADEKDAAELLKWKELYDWIERALDRTEKVAKLQEAFALIHE